MTLSCAYHVDPILNQSDIDNFINPLQDQYIIKLTGDGFKIINGEILFYFGQNILNSHLRYLWQSVLHVPWFEITCMTVKERIYLKGNES